MLFPGYVLNFQEVEKYIVILGTSEGIHYHTFGTCLAVCREGTAHTTSFNCQLPTATKRNEFTLSKIFCVLDTALRLFLSGGCFAKNC